MTDVLSNAKFFPSHLPQDIRSRSQLKEVGRGKMVAMEMSAGSGDEEKEEGEIDSEGEELMSEGLGGWKGLCEALNTLAFSDDKEEAS